MRNCAGMCSGVLSVPTASDSVCSVAPDKDRGGERGGGEEREREGEGEGEKVRRADLPSAPFPSLVCP